MKRMQTRIQFRNYYIFKGLKRKSFTFQTAIFIIRQDFKRSTFKKSGLIKLCYIRRGDRIKCLDDFLLNCSGPPIDFCNILSVSVCTEIKHGLSGILVQDLLYHIFAAQYRPRRKLGAVSVRNRINLCKPWFTAQYFGIYNSLISAFLLHAGIDIRIKIRFHSLLPPAGLRFLFEIRLF